MSDYWFNVNTKQVEQGAQSSWKHLLGPYKTYEEAARALEKVQQRNEDWENDDDA
ncbi:SPOR domain-containing protein [Nesterenkonia sp. MY13]|uniref:SPOR domain-containing protein n=1 Tax=Nesterenkonia sedimenti TaxID=1463632 RepID=A0A7X8TH89_9MICC|nr:SPOR domain-containing protein [Nesterenkonia sedimenti]NLS08699.1 SPOR domain-containing protein [Nesterenkonia sedimenti]